MKETETTKIDGPILRKEGLKDGRVRVVTNWAIKGKITNSERVILGFPSFEALLDSPCSGANTVYLGIMKTMFADGTELFSHIINCFD